MKDRLNEQFAVLERIRHQIDYDEVTPREGARDEELDAILEPSQTEQPPPVLPKKQLNAPTADTDFPQNSLKQTDLTSKPLRKHNQLPTIAAVAPTKQFQQQKSIAAVRPQIVKNLDVIQNDPNSPRGEQYPFAKVKVFKVNPQETLRPPAPAMFLPPLKQNRGNYSDRSPARRNELTAAAASQQCKIKNQTYRVMRRETRTTELRNAVVQDTHLVHVTPESKKKVYCHKTPSSKGTVVTFDEHEKIEHSSLPHSELSPRRNKPSWKQRAMEGAEATKSLQSQYHERCHTDDKLALSYGSQKSGKMVSNTRDDPTYLKNQHPNYSTATHLANNLLHQSQNKGQQYANQANHQGHLQQATQPHIYQHGPKETHKRDQYGTSENDPGNGRCCEHSYERGAKYPGKHCKLREVLEGEKEELKDTIKEKQMEYDRLQRKFDEVMADTKRVAKFADGVKSEKVGMEQTLEQLSRRKAELEKETSTYATMLDIQMKNLNDAMAKAKSQKDEFEKQLDDLRLEMEKMRFENNRLKETISDYEDNEKSNEEAQLEMQQNCDSANENVRQLQENVATLTQKMNGLREEIQTVQSAKDEAEKRMNKVLKANDQFAERIHELRQCVEDRDSKIKDIICERVDLEQKVTTLSTDLTDRDEKIAFLEQRNANLVEDSVILRAKLSEMEAEVERQKKQHEEYESSMCLLQGQINELETCLKVTRDQQTKSAHEYEQRIRQLKEKLIDLEMQPKAENSEETEKKNAETDALQAQIQKLTEQMQKLQSQEHESKRPKPIQQPIQHPIQQPIQQPIQNGHNSELQRQKLLAQLAELDRQKAMPPVRQSAPQPMQTVVDTDDLARLTEKLRALEQSKQILELQAKIGHIERQKTGHGSQGRPPGQISALNGQIAQLQQHSDIIHEESGGGSAPMQMMYNSEIEKLSQTVKGLDNQRFAVRQQLEALSNNLQSMVYRPTSQAQSHPNHNPPKYPGTSQSIDMAGLSLPQIAPSQDDQLNSSVTRDYTFTMPPQQD